MSELAEKSQATTEVSQLVEHLFRHEAGKLVSVLTGIFGTERLQLAEDVVQESRFERCRAGPIMGSQKIRRHGSRKLQNT